MYILHVILFIGTQRDEKHILSENGVGKNTYGVTVCIPTELTEFNFPVNKTKYEVSTLWV